MAQGRREPDGGKHTSGEVYCSSWETIKRLKSNVLVTGRGV